MREEWVDPERHGAIGCDPSTERTAVAAEAVGVPAVAGDVHHTGEITAILRLDGPKARAQMRAEAAPIGFGEIEIAVLRHSPSSEGICGEGDGEGDGVADGVIEEGAAGFSTAVLPHPIARHVAATTLMCNTEHRVLYRCGTFERSYGPLWLAREVTS